MSESCGPRERGIQDFNSENTRLLFNISSRQSTPVPEFLKVNDAVVAELDHTGGRLPRRALGRHHQDGMLVKKTPSSSDSAGET